MAFLFPSPFTLSLGNLTMPRLTLIECFKPASPRLHPHSFNATSGKESDDLAPTPPLRNNDSCVSRFFGCGFRALRSRPRPGARSNRSGPGPGARSCPATEFHFPTPEERAAINAASAVERDRELKLLGITAMQPPATAYDIGKPGNANYDESKANPYPNLPALLVMNNGTEGQKSCPVGQAPEGDRGRI